MQAATYRQPQRLKPLQQPGKTPQLLHSALRDNGVLVTHFDPKGPAPPEPPPPPAPADPPLPEVVASHSPVVPLFVNPG